MKRLFVSAITVLAMGALTGVAHADFGQGNTVVTLESDEKYQRPYRVQKGDDVTIGVVADTATKASIVCGVVDADGDVVTADQGDGCHLHFQAGYSGKYKLVVKNSKVKTIVVITATW